MADRTYQRRNRQERKRRQQAEASAASQVTKLSVAPAPVPDNPGLVEVGVLAEIEKLSTAVSRPGLVQVALALARVLDNPLAFAQQPSAAYRLSETLDKLRKGAEARRGRLASVRQMTRSAAEATG